MEYYNISQSYFATRLGISQKHINGKADIILEMAASIERLTEISIDFIIKSEYRKIVTKKLLDLYKDEKTIEKKMKQEFYLKELNERKWVDFKNITDCIQNYIDIMNFLKVKDLDSLTKIQEKILFKKRGNDLNKLNLWIARVLSGTKVRGCFKVKGRNPAIYITKNYSGKDSFYFELFHELGHCKSDYNEAKSKVIVDANEKQEKRADEFALNMMIDKMVWKEIEIDYHEKILLKISKEYRVPMSFIVGRLAKLYKITYKSELYNKYKLQ